jgi:hypothetical protein
VKRVDKMSVIDVTINTTRHLAAPSMELTIVENAFGLYVSERYMSGFQRY